MFKTILMRLYRVMCCESVIYQSILKSKTRPKFADRHEVFLYLRIKNVHVSYSVT